MSLTAESWKKKAFVFLSSQTLSLFGSSIIQYALFWYVTLETKSGSLLTVYIVCGFLPTFFLAPFGGVWADRYDRKKLIMIADGMIALTTLFLALAFMQGEKSMWLVMLAAALRAAGAAVQQPAVGAILPQFVPVEHLARVNGISGTLQSVNGLVAPLVSGLLIALWPIHVLFFIDVITAAIAIIILLLFFPLPPHEKASSERQLSYFTDMRLGLVYIREHKYLISYFTFVGIFLFLVTPGAFLTPLQVVRTFGSDVWRLSAVEIAFASGMIIGGAVLSLWSGFANRMLTLVLASGFMGLCTLALGLLPWFWPYLAVMLIFGIGLMFFHTPSTVFLQEHVEGDFLGRVFSFNTMLFSSLMPLGMLLFGPLAEAVSIETLLIITGLLMMFHTLIATRHKTLMQAGTAKPKGE